MSETTNLSLPLLAAGQAQKHVTVNEALARIDASVHLGVLDRDRTAPPSEPEEGDRHIVAADATGTWSGWDGAVAAFQSGGWLRLAPRAGWCAYVTGDSAVLFHDGADWQPLGNFIGGIGELPSLGVGTAADETNTFAAKLNTALWTARIAAEGGTGDLRYVMNKEGAAGVLSLLFQSGYEGRAEVGLVGDDDLVVKVSGDGESWHEAIRIDRTSGAVDFPSGATGAGGGEGGGSVPPDLDLTLALIALETADLSGRALFLGASGNRVADSFDTLTYVDVAGATNLDSGTVGLLKPIFGSEALIPTDIGSVIGDVDSGSANAFDGSSSAPSALKTASATSAYIGKNYTAAPRKISKGTVHPSATSGFAGSSIANLTINLRGKNGSAPSSAGDGTQLGTTGSFADGASPKTITSSDTATAWDYVWFQFVSGGGSDSFILNEAQFYQPGTIQNLTVCSTAFTAATAPTTARIVARINALGTVVPGVNLMFDVSRDNGVTWTAADMSTRFSQSSNVTVLESDDTSLSSQPSGTLMRWRVRTASSLAVELLDVHLAWS